MPCRPLFVNANLRSGKLSDMNDMGKVLQLCEACADSVLVSTTHYCVGIPLGSAVTEDLY